MAASAIDEPVAGESIPRCCSDQPERFTGLIEELMVVLDVEFGIIDVRPDEQLIDEGHLDSLAIVELVLILEEAFEIQIVDDDIESGSFSTLEAIAALVKRAAS